MITAGSDNPPIASQDPTRRSTARSISLATVLGLGALAFLIRIFWIDHPALWKDEVFSVVYTWHSYGHHFDLHRTSDIHPPLFPVALKAWISIFGDGRTAMRSLSVLFGALSIPALYLIVLRWTNNRLAVLSGLLLAVNPTHIHFSRELRNYAELSFFLIWATFFFSELAARTSRSRPSVQIAAFALCLALTFYTHYIAVLFFPLFGLAALALLAVNRDLEAFKFQCAGIVIAGLLCLPQSIHMFGFSMASGTSMNEWIQPTTFTIFYQQTLGAYPYPAIFKPVMAAIYLLGCWRLYLNSRPLFAISVVFTVLSLLLCAFMGLFKGIYLVRSIQCFVLMSPVLLASAITALPGRRLEVAAAAAIAALSLWSARADYPVHPIGEPGQALKAALARTQPRAVFYNPDVHYYLEALRVDMKGWRGVLLDKVDEGTVSVNDHLVRCHRNGMTCGSTALIIVVRPPFFAKQSQQWNAQADAWKQTYGASIDETSNGYRIIVLN